MLATHKDPESCSPCLDTGNNADDDGACERRAVMPHAKRRARSVHGRGLGGVCVSLLCSRSLASSSFACGDGI